MSRHHYEAERRYREKHREEINAKCRARYWANIEENRRIKREQGKRLRKADPEKYRAMHRRWEHAHPEKIREYHERHKHKYKERKALTRRKRNLRNLCGVTLEWYDATWEKQGGVCAICGNGETAKQKGRYLPLSVDHCHETKQPRGLLCLACNSGLGKLRDSPELLRKAATYLEYHKAAPRIATHLLNGH